MRVWRLAHPTDPGRAQGSERTRDGGRILRGRATHPCRRRRRRDPSLGAEPGTGARRCRLHPGRTHPRRDARRSAAAARPRRVGDGSTALAACSRTSSIRCISPSTATGDARSLPASEARSSSGTWRRAHMRVLLPVDRTVLAAALSPDGRWLASAEDGRLRLLRWPGRDPLVLSRSQPAASKFVAFTARRSAPTAAASLLPATTARRASSASGTSGSWMRAPQQRPAACCS